MAFAPPDTVEDVWNASLLRVYRRCGLRSIPELEGRHGIGHVLQQKRMRVFGFNLKRQRKGGNTPGPAKTRRAPFWLCKDSRSMVI